MNFDKTEKYASLFSSIAVFAGVVLLIIELQQNSELARVELIASASQTETDLDTALLDADTARTIAKIMSNSVELSDQELLQFDALAVRLIRNMNTRLRYFDLGLFDTDGTGNISETVCFYFNNEVGRAYLRSPATGNSRGANVYRNALHNCDENSGFLEFMRRELGTEPNK